MTTEDFVQLVTASEFLEAARQQLLIDNAPWMTPEERARLAQQIDDTGTKMEQNEEGILKEMEGVEEAIAGFTKEELPKMRKEMESQQQQTDESTAEQLLEDL